METLQGIKRTHECAELNKSLIGCEVNLSGWVARRRDHGGLIFIDLRDRSGIVQLFFSPNTAQAAFAKAEAIRSEYVIAVKGSVTERAADTVNPNMKTGEIEIHVAELRILNAAKTPPFYMQDNIEVDETLRLKHRYLDLRRPEMQQLMILRHKVIKKIRDYFDTNGFLEIETPMLTKSTPEGARDYLVPSRVHPGEFYALPQSPQIFKQLLMVAGMEKYFQIARCFRDEDLRADRQPEFTQLDVEVSFIERDDILELTENLVTKLFAEVRGQELQTPFIRLSYDEAMARFGSDKPDIRFGLELIDITQAVQGAEFKIFSTVISNGGQVKAINVKGYANISRRELDNLTEYVAGFGAKGLAWLAYTQEGIKSQVTKFLSEEIIGKIAVNTEAQTGDLVLIIADNPSVTAAALGQLRLEMARRLELIDNDQFAFLWVLDFPMFEYDAEDKRWVAMHHPFTSPRDEDIAFIASEPGKLRAKAYDLVLNGVELGGGSIRIYNRDIQEKVFGAIGMTQEETVKKFGFLLEAFEYGTPPHGGIALGLDRMIMLMAKRASIRDVIAFPKTQSASDVMVQAPSEVAQRQLKELHIKSDIPVIKGTH